MFAMLEHVVSRLSSHWATGRSSSKTQGLGLGLKLEFGPGPGLPSGASGWVLWLEVRRSQCTGVHGGRHEMYKVRRARGEGVEGAKVRRLRRGRRCALCDGGCRVRGVARALGE